MGRKILIISGSSRSNGNTNKVIDHIKEKVAVDVVDLNQKEISYYDYDHRNAGDDFLPLMRKFVEKYDVLVLMSPIYWYTMSAQLKTFLDRTSDMLTIEKELGRKLRGKTMMSISNSDQDMDVSDFVSPVQKSANYLGMNYEGNAHVYFDQDELSDQSVIRLASFFKV